MPTLALTEDEPLSVPFALAKTLEEASLREVAHAARIFDAKARPALILIADGELVLVTRRGVQRWTPAELVAVEGGRIVPVDGPPVEILNWHQEVRRTAFLRAARAFLGLPEPSSPPPAPAPAPPTAEQMARAARSLGVMAAVLTGIIVTLAVATLAAYLYHWDSLAGLAIGTILLGFVLGIPLLVASFKLAALDSRWWPLSIAGFAVGGASIVVFALCALFVVAWGLACGSEGCLR